MSHALNACMRKWGYFTLLFALLYAGPIASQDLTFGFAATMGGELISESESIALDASGNIYPAGSFMGSISKPIDFDPGPGELLISSASSTETDAFVHKLDADGNLVWAKTLGNFGNDYGRNLAVDNSGNVYIAGSFEQTVDFDPGAGTNSIPSGGSWGAYVLKLYANGDFV